MEPPASCLLAREPACWPGPRPLQCSWWWWGERMVEVSKFKWRGREGSGRCFVTDRRLEGRGGCRLQASGCQDQLVPLLSLQPKSQLPTPFLTLLCLVEGTSNFQVIFLAQTGRGEGGKEKETQTCGFLLCESSLLCHCCPDSSQTAKLWCPPLRQAANVWRG